MTMGEPPCDSCRIRAKKCVDGPEGSQGACHDCAKFRLECGLRSPKKPQWLRKRENLATARKLIGDHIKKHPSPSTPILHISHLWNVENTAPPWPTSAANISSPQTHTIDNNGLQAQPSGHTASSIPSSAQSNFPNAGPWMPQANHNPIANSNASLNSQDLQGDNNNRMVHQESIVQSHPWEGEQPWPVHDYLPEPSAINISQDDYTASFGESWDANPRAQDPWDDDNFMDYP